MIKIDLSSKTVEDEFDHQENLNDNDDDDSPIEVVKISKPINEDNPMVINNRSIDIEEFTEVPFEEVQV